MLDAFSTVTMSSPSRGVARRRCRTFAPSASRATSGEATATWIERPALRYGMAVPCEHECVRMAVVVAVLLMASACSSGSEEHPSDSGMGGMTSVDSFITWLGEHEANVSVVALTGAGRDVAVSHRPDERRPLASVRKVLILGAYAEGVASGGMDAAEHVSLDEVERWWVPGTDGGAHDSAVAEARDLGWLVAGEVELDRVVWAMVRWSDNAAADYLLARLGAHRVATFAADHGITSTERLVSSLGEVLSWSEVAVDQWEQMTSAERAEHSTCFESSRQGPVRDLRLPGADEQRRLAKTTTAGTAREWANLMANIATGQGFDEKAAEIMRRHLEWPIQAFPANRAQFQQFGTKGGSLVGVLTEASFLRTTGGDLVAVALFLDGLEDDAWRSATEGFVHQQLLVALATNPSVRQQLSATLNSEG